MSTTSTRDAAVGGGSESRLLAMLLNEMDSVRSQSEALLVLGATNRPDMMDQVTIANAGAEFNQFL